MTGFGGAGFTSASTESLFKAMKINILLTLSEREKIYTRERLKCPEMSGEMEKNAMRTIRT